jgi:hypothetical protein
MRALLPSLQKERSIKVIILEADLAFFGTDSVC